MGNRPAGLVARLLFPDESSEDKTDQQKTSGRAPLAIQGTEGMVVAYGKCCYPIPGDQIVGKLSKGRGLVIHQISCKNIYSDRMQNENMIDVKWADNPSGEYACQLNLYVNNERGVLARLATIISDESANIEHVEVEDKDGLSTNITFLISVSGRNHLARILRRLRRIKSVMRIARAQ